MSAMRLCVLQVSSCSLRQEDLPELLSRACLCAHEPFWDQFTSLGKAMWHHVVQVVTCSLKAGCPDGQDDAGLTCAICVHILSMHPCLHGGRFLSLGTQSCLVQQ